LAKQNKKKLNVFLSLIKIISFLIAFCLVLITLFVGVFIYFNSPPPNSMPLLVFERDGVKLAEDGSYYIDVRKGESSQSVGLRLERTGLIRNRYFWNILNRLQKGYLKTGTYKIEMPESQLSIYRILVSGRQILHKVTIPEGVTISKTASILEDSGICSASDFLNAAKNGEIISRYNIPNASMEGYLFPDTYLFPAQYPADMAVTVMADNFFRKLEQINPSIKDMSSKEINEKVILASIVEREYRLAEEAPLMAGVFYNRLKINMAIQSCATIEYIITEIQNKPHPSVILNVDLEIDNPYNTYVRPGLPPGPISAPGTVALKAVFFPKETQYFYFRLEDPSVGRHYFSRTYDEHIRLGQLIPKGQF